MERFIAKKYGRRVCAFILAFTLLLTSVQTSPIFVDAAKKKKVTSVSITKPVTSTLTLKKGSTYKIGIKVLPKNASNKKLKFKSSKASVVSVSSKGKLKAKKTGSSKITVTARDGSKKSSSITVTVVKKLKKVTKVTLTPSSKTLYVGGTSAEAKVTLNAKLQPSKATNKKVSYVSSSKSVATVNSKGIVVAKKVGRATITAYAKDGRGAKGTCKVTVQQNPFNSPNATSTPNVTNEPPTTDFTIATGKATKKIYIDEAGADYKGLKLVMESFVEDVNLVADCKPTIVTDTANLGKEVIVAGSIGNNSLIDKWIKDGKLWVGDIAPFWETYKIVIIENPQVGIDKALVIVGSDKRATMYGIYHISEMMGVSPWVYWGDVTPKKQATVAFTADELNMTSKEPSVKYRGIFLNDEAPSLSSWVEKNFKSGSQQPYNEKFYKHVYEVILRLKGNYLWPAMWNSRFGTDGASLPAANAILANDYGIVMGTSHHEPMMRADKEWRDLFPSNDAGKKEAVSKWNYDTNKAQLDVFWDASAKERSGYENLITLGMRGMEDTALLPAGSTVQQNVDHLKDIISNQKEILKKNGLEDAPKVITLYKEVEEYWYGSDTVSGLKDWKELDDVTIMLTEDNFGNLRTLPEPGTNSANRKNGWGMYYHFDYHGGPTSYEWVNTIQNLKIWEQMSMAYDYGVNDIWIVNVGDLKPMELPISYFLDMAYDFDKWGTSNLDSAETYTREWTEQQFGNDTNEKGIDDITSILEGYTKLNGARKPETIIATTYSVANFNEALRKLSELEELITLADSYKNSLPAAAQAAYYQLVYYPAVASANVHRMQIYDGLNKFYYDQGRSHANVYAELLKESIQLDKDLQSTYNKTMPGVGTKWNGMMSSKHVGYITWNDEGAAYPTPRYIEIAEKASMLVYPQADSKVYKSGTAKLPDFTSTNKEVYYIDIANAGGNSFDYTVSADKEWIKLTETSGNVITQDTIGISVDFTKLTADSTGTVTIQGAEKEVKIEISAKVESTAGLDSMTFIEANNFISIEAAHYFDKKAGTNGSSWQEIIGYGRTLSSLKVFPTTLTFSDSENAPYLEYKVKAATAGEYTLQTYVAPSNNVAFGKPTMKYGVSVNGGTVDKVDSLTTGFAPGSYSGTWTKNVTENIRLTTSKVTLTKGVNTIRIYSVDAALVLQKLVLYPTAKPLPASYFGPEESYYVGKVVNSKLVTDVQKEVYVAPYTRVATANNQYESIFPIKAKCKVKIKANVKEAATVTVKWGSTTVGTIPVTTGQTDYSMETAEDINVGKGIFSFDLSGKDVTIQEVSFSPRIIHVVPCTMIGGEENYDVNLTNDDKYEVEIKVSSSVAGKVGIMWKGEKVGEIDVASTGMFFSGITSTLTKGTGLFSLDTGTTGIEIEDIYIAAEDTRETIPVAITASTQDGENIAKNVFSRDAREVWKPTVGDANPYLEFNFTENINIDRIILNENGKNVEEYEVQIHTGTAWETVYTGGAIENEMEVFIHGKKEIRGQKIRIAFTKTNAIPTISQVILTPYTNWAIQDGGVKVEGIGTGGKDVLGPLTINANIIDGDRMTNNALEVSCGGNTGASDPFYNVTMEFGTERTIDCINLISKQQSEPYVIPNMYLKSNAVQQTYIFNYWDGTKWVKLKEITETVDVERKVFNTVSLDKPITTNKIKVDIKTSNWIRIVELEALQTKKMVVSQ